MRRLGRPFAGLVVVLGLLAGAVPGAADTGTPLIARSVADPRVRGGLGPADAPSLSLPPAEEVVRATGDRADTVSGKQTHAVYFVPADRPDESLDRNGWIAAQMSAVASWFSSQAGRAPRIDRIAGGAIDVSFVRGARVAADYQAIGQQSFLAEIARELRGRGYNASGKRYVVFAAIPSGTTCGEAFTPGSFASVYLDAAPGCGVRNGRASAIAAHEWLHADGAVPVFAPRHCAVAISHVCTGPLAWVGLDPESRDILYPYITGGLSSKVLDIGRNDYFGHPWPYADSADSPWLE